MDRIVVTPKPTGTVEIVLHLMPERARVFADAVTHQVVWAKTDATAEFSALHNALSAAAGEETWADAHEDDYTVESV